MSPLDALPDRPLTLDEVDRLGARAEEIQGAYSIPKSRGSEEVEFVCLLIDGKVHVLGYTDDDGWHSEVVFRGASVEEFHELVADVFANLGFPVKYR